MSAYRPPRVGVLGPPPRPPLLVGEANGCGRFECGSGGPGLDREPRLEAGVVAVAVVVRLDTDDDERLSVRTVAAGTVAGGILFSSSSSASSSSSSASPHRLGETGKPARACFMMSADVVAAPCFFTFLLSRGGVTRTSVELEMAVAASPVASMSMGDEEAAAAAGVESASALADDRCVRFLLLRGGEADGEAASEAAMDEAAAVVAAGTATKADADATAGTAAATGSASTAADTRAAGTAGCCWRLACVNWHASPRAHRPARWY